MLILAPVRDPPVVYLDQGDPMVAMRPLISIFRSPNLPVFVEQDRPPRGPLLIALVVLKERAQLFTVVELISQRVRIMYVSGKDLTGPFVVAPRPGVGQRFEHGLEFCLCHLFASQNVYLRLPGRRSDQVSLARLFKAGTTSASTHSRGSDD